MGSLDLVQSRHCVLVGLAAFLAAAAFLCSAPAAHSFPDGFDYGASRPYVKCVRSGQSEVRARVTANMWVHNRGWNTGWVNSFRMSARLIPTTTGYNIDRAWKKTRFPVFSNLLQDTNYSHNMAVVTNPESRYEDWIVQVKQTWTRKSLRDLHREFRVHFGTGESRCPTGEDAVSLGRIP
jgi:hypothetical protein